MQYATPQNTEIGETVLIPLQNEFMHDEQICIEYEVILALKAKIKPNKQVVGAGQEPLPEIMPFIYDMFYKLD